MNVHRHLVLSRRRRQRRRSVHSCRRSPVDFFPLLLPLAQSRLGFRRTAEASMSARPSRHTHSTGSSSSARARTFCGAAEGHWFLGLGRFGIHPKKGNGPTG